MEDAADASPYIARPDDPDLLRAQMLLLVSQHDYAGARLVEKKIMDSGQASSSDCNNYEGSACLTIILARILQKPHSNSTCCQRTQASPTCIRWACIYAAQDKVTEARQVLVQAIAAGQISKLSSSVWYALGLLYEDYGFPEAALDAYTHVQAHESDDERGFVDTESTYILAKSRLQFLDPSRLPLELKYRNGSQPIKIIVISERAR